MWMKAKKYLYWLMVLQAVAGLAIAFALQSGGLGFCSLFVGGFYALMLKLEFYNE